jgi:hypothetical protein
MSAADTVSDRVFSSLVELDQRATTDVAEQVALATLIGACRAYCELNRHRLPERDLRQRVLQTLKDASPLCSQVFRTEH